MTEYYRIPLGPAAAYLVKGQNGYSLIDAGSKGKEQVFFDHLQRLGVCPEELRLIVITHVHYDHVGGLAEIRETCQCPIVVHESEAELLKKAIISAPPSPTTSTGRLLSFIGRKLMPVERSFAPVKPDILISKELLLDEYGLKGSILCTPGHTTGSISVLLLSGEAFVGDLASSFPFQWAFPAYAEEPHEVLKSWRKILDFGAKTILPSHGKSFGAGRLAKEYEKRTLRLKTQKTNQQKLRRIS